MTKAANLAASANATAGNVTATNIQSNAAGTPTVFQDSAGTQVGTLCRAWVNFNGTGTVAIRASFNVSSITDNGTGNYTVNFTTAMPDTNYSTVTSCTPTTSAAERTKIGTVATSSVQILNSTCDAANNSYDAVLVTAAIFR